MNDLFKEDELEVLREIGQRLRFIRKKRELTQELLAAKAGFSRSYYSDIETGKRNISILNLCKLTIALDITLSELLEPVKDYAAKKELIAANAMDSYERSCSR